MLITIQGALSVYKMIEMLLTVLKIEIHVFIGTHRKEILIRNLQKDFFWDIARHLTSLNK